MRSAFASYLLLFFFLAAAVAANPARAGTTCQNLMVDSAKLLAQSLINCDIAATQSKPCEDPTLAFKTAYDAIKIATPQGCGFLYETHYVIDKWSNIFLPTRDQECTISACKASGDKRRNLRTIDQLFIGEFNRLFSAYCDDTRLSLNATFTKRLTNLSAGKSYRDAVAARQSALLPTIGAICSDIISTATVDASLATITTTSGILNLIDVDNGAIVNAAVHDPQGELIGVTRFTISWGRVDQAGLLDTPNGIPLGDSVFKLPVFREKLLQDAADDELRPILVSLLDANSNLKRVVGPISVRTDIIAPGLPQLVFPSRIALDAAGSIKVVDGLNPPSTFTQDQITLVAKTDALFHGTSSPYLSASASQLRVSVGGTDVGTLPKDISNVGPGGTIQIVIPKSVFGGQKGSLLATAQLIDQASNHGPLVTGTILLDIDKPIVPDLAEPEIKDGGMTCRGLGPIINSDHPVATITAKTVVTGDTLVTSLSGVSNVSPDTRPLALSNDFTLPEINSPKSPATPNAVIKAQTFRGNVGSSIVSKGFFIDTVKPIAPTPNVSCADTTPTSPCDLVFKLQDQDDRITFTTGGLNCSSTGAMATCLKVAANETLDYTVEDWACNQLHSSYTLTPIIASATRVKFTATPTSIPSGSPVTLSAEVTGEGGPGKDPTGLVSFTEGANLLGTAVLDGSSRGSVTAILKGTGDHSITAHYEGDKNNQSSVAFAVVTVTPQALSPTQSLLSPSTTSLIEGSTLILTGTVQTASNNGIAPSGTLTFSEGATPLGTSTLDRNQKANISLTNLSAGTHIFIVSYSGDSLYSPSLSPPITVTVTTSRSNTQTLLTASKLNLVSTETLTFNAQVSQSTPNGHLPSGLVTFQGSNGRTNSAALDAQGQANISGIAFTPGTYTITANYPGDTYNQPSTSNTLTLTVTNPQTTSTTSLTAAPATVKQGTPITFTAHVSGNTVVGQFPTGNVSFMEGTITLANGLLDANQNATFTTNQLTPGTHVITASYLGDASNVGSSSAPVTVTVTAINSPPSSINLSYTPSGPTSSNTPITVTASVSGFQNTQGPIPTGSVTFFDGNTQIQTVPLNNGVASMQKTFSSGGHSLGATLAPMGMLQVALKESFLSFSSCERSITGVETSSKAMMGCP